MKLIFLLLTTAWLINPIKIREINTVKKQAREAYSKGDYKTTIARYRHLVDSMEVDSDAVLLNLGHAYYQTNDTTNALSTYQLVSASNAKLSSIAYQQMGVIKNKQGKPTEALQYFKDAIKADASNMDARYNYELLKKYMEYPEIILTKFRLLVDQHRYKEARNFLKRKMRENKRIRQYKDYNDRVQIIITIDSLAQR
jgi:Ca-activated chloride channel family protein